MTIERRRSILSQPTLKVKDIAELENISTGTAQKRMQICKKYYDGKVPMNERMIKTKSYFAYLGYNEEEAKKYLEGLFNSDDKQV